MFALIDCNNFYVSCERLFRPDLRDRPVIVLSNNDGCAIARSNEAKALGIAMGTPYFQIKDLCKKHRVAVFSSNYALYADLSQRVMRLIEQQWPVLEIYSIDEAFLNLEGLNNQQQTAFCSRLQKLVLKHIGIPTSIGIGKSKTQAKIANYIAKKRLGIPVVHLADFPDWLDKIAVAEVWGVGRRWAEKLEAIGIKTAGDLARANPGLIKKRFSVVLQRTVYELRGLSCLSLEEIEAKQSIVSSRSFGSLQTDYKALEEAISTYTARAWEKLRRQQSLVQYLSVFILSNRHRGDLKQYSNHIGFKLINPSDDLRVLTASAKHCLKQIYRPGIAYKKAGVMLEGLMPQSPVQADLFSPLPEVERSKTEQLMQTIEHINQRFGRQGLHLAATGKQKAPWAMKRGLKSPDYTTQWQDLLRVLL